MAVYKGQVRTVPGGSPVPDGTPIEIRAELDDSLLASTTTTNGEWSVEINGTFPPYYVEAVSADVTKVTSSKVTGMSGALHVASLAYLMRGLGEGVIDGLLNELGVTANGSNLQITIATGAAHVHGVIYDNITAETVTLSAADGSNPRIDTIAIEVAPPGAGANLEGRSEIVVVEGSPASSPTAPSLTESDTVWQFPLADIRVNAGATAITSGNVTDRRTMMTSGLSESALYQIIGDFLMEMGENSAHIDYIYGEDLPFLGDMNHMSIDLEWLEGWLADTLTAGDNVTIQHNDGDDEIVISSTGGGGGGGTGPARLYKDTNFTTSGRITSASGNRELGRASITLPAGTYLIHSQVHLSAFNDDNSQGYVTVYLSGNGTPQGSDQSSRNFRTRTLNSRQIILTGRRLLTVASTTTVTAIAYARYHSGAASYLEDGVVFLWAE